MTVTHFLQVWASALRGTRLDIGLGSNYADYGWAYVTRVHPSPSQGSFFFVCGPEIESRNQDIGRQTNCTEDGPVLPAGGGPFCGK